MSGIVYLNGDFCNAEDAKISLFDQGVLFGDSVYEVIPVYNGHPAFLDRHLKRLASSLKNTKIASPDIDWQDVFKDLIARNGGGDMQLYLQITRGNQGTRKYDLPPNITPTFFAFTLHVPFPLDDSKGQGLHANIVEDYRWLRCNIKATSLLANILLNNEAMSAGAQTALLSRNGLLTEGSASNVFLVDNKGIIKTPPLDNFCLPGITRELTIELINELSLSFVEEHLPIDSLFTAQEVWITSTTKEIYPITRINDHQVGNGLGGPCWQRLNDKFQQLVKNSYGR